MNRLYLPVVTCGMGILMTQGAAQVPDAGLHLEYEVSQLEQSRKTSRGKLVIDRTPARAMVTFDGRGARYTCVIMGSVTLVDIDHIPASSCRVKPGIATGRVLYVPPLAEVLTGFPSVRENNDGSWSCLSLDAVAEGNSLLFESVRARAEKPTATSYPASFDVIYKGATAVRWSFQGTMKIATLLVPRKITRNRFRASGLNIARDDTVIWDLSEARVGSRPLSPDNQLLGNGAVVYDDRSRGRGTMIRFNDAKGGLEKQLEQVPEPDAPEQENSPIWVAAGLGVVVALLATGRRRWARRLGATGERE